MIKIFQPGAVSMSVNNTCWCHNSVIGISCWNFIAVCVDQGNMSCTRRDQVRSLNEGEVFQILERNVCPFFILSYIFYTFKLLQFRTTRVWSYKEAIPPLSSYSLIPDKNDCSLFVSFQVILLWCLFSRLVVCALKR